MSGTKDDGSLNIESGNIKPKRRARPSIGEDEFASCGISSELAGKKWRQPYPGPADRNFHFRKLLEESPNGIGDAANRDDLKVAIIGTGAAGLTAAHELARSGLKNIDMFEATERYGGRLWSETLDDGQEDKQYTVMDMGAMRMPPFISKKQPKEKTGSAMRQRQVWESGNSILSYYLSKYAIRTSEFPNPGSKHCNSGIYYNEGSIEPISSIPEKGSKYIEADENNDEEKLDTGKPETKDKENSEKKNTDYEEYNSDKTAKGQMLIWNADQDDPPNKELRIVSHKWSKFSKRIEDQIEKYYHTNEWPAFWKNIVRNYYNKSFRQVVRDPVLVNEDNILTGDFGGVGLDEEQARIMYVIGIGDGGWGAFYNISFLYVYRVILHGYGKDHQLIEGLFHGDESKDDILKGDEITDGRQMSGNKQNQMVYDSLEIQFKAPEYLGLHSIPDCLLFGKLHIEDEDVELKEESKISIYGNLKKPEEDGYHLFLNSPVSKIERLDSGKVRLHVKNDILINGKYEYDTEYDAVIITVPTHQFGMEIEVTGFYDKMWPYSLQAYLSQAYWIPCAKVFLELKNPYWEDKECTIPQVIASETFTRDTYGIKVNRGTLDKQTGVLLISYTWTRDATKLVSYDDQELINMCVKELDRMLANCKNIRKTDRISKYAQETGTKDKYGETNYKGTVHHWEKQKYYKGAARFYDPLGWDNIRVPMSYNQEISKDSNLYFAGEAYHADAGWVEPAFRSAIDAVLHLFKNNGVNLQVGDDFDFDKDYAKYEAFDPKSEAVSMEKL